MEARAQKAAEYYGVPVEDPLSGQTFFPSWWKPSWNIAPLQRAAVLRQSEGQREFEQMRWGLVPSWAKDQSMAARCINARAETLTEKPAFRGAFKSRRCIVPASGFYEWKTEGKVKTPFYIHPRDGELLSLAALWESWEDAEGASLLTFSIITTDPNALMATIHDRMPAIIPPDRIADWLSPEASGADLAALLRPYRSELLESYEVGKAVGNVKNDGPELIERGQGSLF